MRARSEHRGELQDVLAARFAEHTTEEWMARLHGVVPVAPVRSMEEALDLDALRARSMLAEYEHPELGHVKSLGPPLLVEGYEPRHRPGPALGADGPALLTELGYDEATRAALRERGAFGS
jgi:crotonobetainyl-CoA:carnitine CoA-transferase CaiB-like acyl-CoA transferase